MSILSFAEKNPYNYSVLQAIYNGENKLTIEFIDNFDENANCIVKLERIGNSNNFAGNCRVTKNGRSIQESVNGVLYWNEDSHFVFGEWVSEGTEYYWWCEFENRVD